MVTCHLDILITSSCQNPFSSPNYPHPFANLTNNITIIPQSPHMISSIYQASSLTSMNSYIFSLSRPKLISNPPSSSCFHPLNIHLPFQKHIHFFSEIEHPPKSYLSLYFILSFLSYQMIYINTTNAYNLHIPKILPSTIPSLRLPIISSYKGTLSL